jgi:glycosyltransferase involved in cell wall biosynthesis
VTTPRGIRYFSPVNTSGYGQAAIANIRALVNAGIPVQWVPLDWTPERMRAGNWTLPDGSTRPLLQRCGRSGHLADLPSMVAATARAIDHDTVIAHAPPEFWPFGFERGKRNVGCTAWEADRAPAHWLPLLGQADRVVVPSTQNRDALRDSGLERPIHVVPHIRRHRWCEFTAAEVAQARGDLGIPRHHRVFYTINAWDPRKAIPELIVAYANAFEPGEPVTLLIKTGQNGHGPGPLYPQVPARELAANITRAVAGALGRPLAQIVLHDDELDGDGLDLIHAIGDVYVSLSHGEGWGLGAFEAATLGKPVVMTAWGGQTDYLGSRWTGALSYRFAPAPLWPPHKPSYFPSQRWAEVDPAAASALLRRVHGNPEPALATAREIRERIVREFAEPVVTGRWLEALDG